MSLNRKELIDLAASLHDRWTLSVYIDATTADPAARAAWKTTLRHAIDATRTETQPALRREHDRAVERFDSWLETARIGARQSGWYASATEEGVAAAGELVTDAGTAVHWQKGVWILPFISTLGQRKPALVVLIDSRTAGLHAYANGQLESRGTFR